MIGMTLPEYMTFTEIFPIFFRETHSRQSGTLIYSRSMEVFKTCFMNCELKWDYHIKRVPSISNWGSNQAFVESRVQVWLTLEVCFIYPLDEFEHSRSVFWCVEVLPLEVVVVSHRSHHCSCQVWSQTQFSFVCSMQKSHRFAWWANQWQLFKKDILKGFLNFKLQGLTASPCALLLDLWTPSLWDYVSLKGNRGSLKSTITCKKK